MTQFDSHLPEYTVEEKSEEIVIKVVAPLSKPKEAALILENDVFTFDSPPYLLKIKLPHPVSDRFSEKAFDTNTGTYKVKLQKEEKHMQHDSDDDDDNEVLDPILNVSTGDETKSFSENREKQFYGFANKYSNMFGKLYDEFSDVVNLPDPDYTSVTERRRLRITEENEKWSDDHYLADTMETDHLDLIFKFKPPCMTCPAKDELNSDEIEILSEIIKCSKAGNLSKEMEMLSEFQIVDVLFCYSYNKRTTEGDNTVESGWTINKLSSTLSWFEVFEDLKSVILSCYRRSLIYPLYRNWKLTEMVHKDVVSILKIGPKQVARCLLEVLEIFNGSDNRYLLNTLYINDLCSFGYHMQHERLSELASEVENIRVKKWEVNGDLPLLEIAAHLTLEEELGGSAMPSMKNVIEKIEEMNLGSNCESSNESTESDSDDSDSSQSSDNEN